MKRLISYLLAAAILATSVSGCAQSSDSSNENSSNSRINDDLAEQSNNRVEASALTADLMSSVSPGRAGDRQADVAFIKSMADFSVELFKITADDGKNALVSPLSVMLALAMTANGACGETLAQMEHLLGKGISLSQLNEYLYTYVNQLPNTKEAMLNIANSVWFRDNGLDVSSDFLQTISDYYSADAYKSAFNDQTIEDINSWVETNTDGMIDKILDEIGTDDIMYLINAVMFDAQWQNVYYTENVRDGIFTGINGVQQNAHFMHSEESLYLDDGMATGFIKPYKDGKYSFVALLPNQDVSIDEYIASLSGKKLQDTLAGAQETTVFASMPKFEYEYEINMNDALATLGIPDAFDEVKADFAALGISLRGNIYIDRVLHKTFITVDELGTKAGAVTMVAAAARGAALEAKMVNLDRPFVYVIIDNATNLPIFIGTLMTTG